MRLTKLTDGLLGMAVALSILSRSAGAVPAAVTVQGRLTDSEGLGRNGSFSVKFTVYNAETGGTVLWTKTVSSLPVRGGTFQTLLAETAGQPKLSDVFSGGTPWLELKVLSGPGIPVPEEPMAPRQPLVSVPFSFGAQSAEALVAEGAAVVKAAGAERLRVAADGKVGIGTANPTAALHVAGVAGTDGVRFPDGTLQTRAAGIVYTRWGRTVCPAGAALLYAGWVGGGHYAQSGSGGTLCLSDAPTYDEPSDANEDGALIYGTEYETAAHGVASLRSLQEYKARCAVCYRADATASFMLPASQTCPAGWTAEYAGYLMATHYTQNNRDFCCVDRAPEPAGNQDNHNGNLWYPAEYECGALPCPPFKQDREATCAVCSRR